MNKRTRYLSLLFLVLFLIFSVYSCADAEPDTGMAEIKPGNNSSDSSDNTQNTFETVGDDVVWSPITQNEETETDKPAESSAETPDDQNGGSEGGIAPLALMYHLILDEPYSNLESLFVRPSELRGHIEALLENGYTFIFADEYGYYDTKTVIMSFDDGYIDNYTEMFPIIKEYGVKVTVFMISNYVGGGEYLSQDMIREMSASGLVSFQSHTASHPGLSSLGEEALRNEFEVSNSFIESLTGRKIKAICYPSGQYNDLVLKIASEYYEFGYTTKSTVSTAGYSKMELPRLRVNRGFSKDYFSSVIP